MVDLYYNSKFFKQQQLQTSSVPNNQKLLIATEAINNKKNELEQLRKSVTRITKSTISINSMLIEIREQAQQFEHEKKELEAKNQKTYADILNITELKAGITELRTREEALVQTLKKYDATSILKERLMQIQKIEQELSLIDDTFQAGSPGLTI